MSEPSDWACKKATAWLALYGPSEKPGAKELAYLFDGVRQDYSQEPHCDVCGTSGANLRTPVEVCRDCYDVARDPPSGTGHPIRDEADRYLGQKRVAARGVARALQLLPLVYRGDVSAEEIASELRTALHYLEPPHKSCNLCHGLGTVYMSEGSADCTCGALPALNIFGVDEAGVYHPPTQQAWEAMVRRASEGR
jgi:hypothetical protein